MANDVDGLFKTLLTNRLQGGGPNANSPGPQRPALLGFWGRTWTRGPRCPFDRGAGPWLAIALSHDVRLHGQNPSLPEVRAAQQTDVEHYHAQQRVRGLAYEYVASRWTPTACLWAR